MKCSHSFEHYKKSLQKAINEGYVFLKMEDHKLSKNYEKVIFLRHDIDLSVKNALFFGRIEKGLGISTTYFIRVSGKYNPLFYDNYAIIKELIDMSHEIGLHYSSDLPRITNENRIEFFQIERNILENIIKKKIKGVCIHTPNDDPLISDNNLHQFSLEYYAYSDIFTKNVKYISDSRSTWREGCMCKFIGKFPKLCILTHPFWWYHCASCENY